MKHSIIAAALNTLGATGIARLASPWTQGLGAILMFHHVRPAVRREFDPHAGLEVTPEFLDAVLAYLKEKGYAIIPINTLAERLRHPVPSEPFVVLTFDDGYRDNAVYALPVLRKHAAPFTVFATTGFADGEAPLWWIELAEAVSSGRPLELNGQSFLTADPEEKSTAYAVLYAHFTQLAPVEQRPFLQQLREQAGLGKSQLTRELCLDWQGLRTLADDPLCTIGAHTCTHPLLAHCSLDEARGEMHDSKRMLEIRLGTPVNHMAYPVGSPDAAGKREFGLAASLGYETAVTTRSGMLFPEHADHLHALPRLSVNGMHQSIASFETLLTGLPFFLMNRGKRVMVS